MPKRQSPHANRQIWNRATGLQRMFCVLSLAFCLFLTACFERRESAVINLDGSGKIYIETVVAVPQGLPGREKPTALTFGRQIAADLINSTRGVDAWAGLAITEVDGGKSQVAVTAYFKDINALRFDMPLVFVWKRNETGADFSIERTRTAVKTYDSLSDADLKELVAKAREQYKAQQKALQLQLDAFSLEMRIELPGEISDSNLLTRDGNAVTLTLDGKKTMQALDTFMADDAALAATFKAGADLPANDDLMLQTMFGKPGPVSAHVKIPADAQPAFDYRTEVRVAQLRQSDMLKDAGVELIPKFIVKDPPPASQPTSQPAAQPAAQPK